MKKSEFMSPNFMNYNENEKEEVKVLREIVFQLIREVHVLRESIIQTSLINNIQPKESIYGKMYKEICVLSYNSAGPSSGKDKVLRDWFDSDSELPDEIIMLRKLGYNDSEIRDYLNEISKVQSYT